MAYTEIKKRNNKNYYYRVKSIRKRNKISKKRIYLGANLTNGELNKKEIESDNILNRDKINKNLVKIKPKIIEILKKHSIAKAGIFGSYARGEQNKKSDVDILIEIQGKKFSLLDLIALEMELKRILKIKVDLLTYNGINPLLKERILKEEIRII